MIMNNICPTSDETKPCELFPKLLFVHIPKTAGLSLNAELTNCFGRSSSFRAGDSAGIKKLKKLTSDELKNFTYITGHMTLHDFRCKGIDYPAITIVRNPIDRFLSMFNYLNQSDHPDHQSLKFEKIDNFIDYLFNKKQDNIQCKFIGNEKEHSKSIEIIQNGLLYLAPLEYIDDMIKTLSGIFNKPLQLSHTNKSHKTEKDSSNRLVIQRELKQFWDEDMKLHEFVVENYFTLKAVMLKIFCAR
jgi:hypothetical protein